MQTKWVSKDGRLQGEIVDGVLKLNKKSQRKLAQENIAKLLYQ